MMSPDEYGQLRATLERPKLRVITETELLESLRPPWRPRVTLSPDVPPPQSWSEMGRPLAGLSPTVQARCALWAAEEVVESCRRVTIFNILRDPEFPGLALRAVQRFFDGQLTVAELRMLGRSAEQFLWAVPKTEAILLLCHLLTNVIEAAWVRKTPASDSTSPSRSACLAAGALMRHVRPDWPNWPSTWWQRCCNRLAFAFVHEAELLVG